MPSTRKRTKRDGGDCTDGGETYSQKLKKRMSSKDAETVSAETNNNNKKKSACSPVLEPDSSVVDRLTSVVRDSEGDWKFKGRRREPVIPTYTPPYLKSGNIVHYLQQYSQGQRITCKLQQGVTKSVVDMIADMQLCRTASPFDRRVTAMEWHPTNPDIVAVGSKGGDIIIWNTVTMEKDKFIQGKGSGGNIQAMQFWAEDYGKVVTAGLDGTVTLHDFEGLNTQILADTRNFYDFWYCSVDVQTRGKFVVAGDNVGKVQFLSYDGKMIFNQRLHKKKVTHCEFSPQEEWLLCTASVDQTVKFWDVRMVKDKKSVLYTLPHDMGVNSAYFSRTDGCRILTTDQNNQVRVYSAPEWHLEKTILHPHRFFQHITPIKATWYPLRDLAVVGRYPDPKFPGYYDNEPRTIDLIDVEKEEVVASLNDPAAPGIVCVNKFNHRGDTLVSGMGVNILLWKRKEEVADIHETLIKNFPRGEGTGERSRSNRRPRTRDGDDDLKKSKTKKKDNQTKQLKEKVQTKTKSKK